MSGEAAVEQAQGLDVSWVSPLRQIKATGTPKVVQVEQSLQQFFGYAASIGFVVIDPLRIRQCEHRQGIRPTEFADGLLQRVGSGGVAVAVMRTMSCCWQASQMSRSIAFRSNPRVAKL